ncbi:hypothetical protein KAU25_03920 [Candidatus Bathyarchaeota archaeon]|nr:hypothetical protein [Candidatus Bathyarchaeota archaeon]
MERVATSRTRPLSVCSGIWNTCQELLEVNERLAVQNSYYVLTQMNLGVMVFLAEPLASFRGKSRREDTRKNLSEKSGIWIGFHERRGVDFG